MVSTVILRLLGSRICVVRMPSWVQGSHSNARAKFVALVVRMFGSLCTGPSVAETKCTLVYSQELVGDTDAKKWREAMVKCSSDVRDTLEGLGVLTLEDANVAMYTCIVALSRYNWGVRGPADSSKRFWVREGRKLTGLDMLSLIEVLPEQHR